MRSAAGRAVPRTRFACSACGEVSPKWQGRCSSCLEWNTLVEEVERPGVRRSAPPAAATTTTMDSAAAATECGREATGIAELDRVLGGGIVPGALILLGGDPGIGKSTLALQLARRRAGPGRPALYCAGEESAAQLGLRARRLGCDSADIRVLVETDLDVLTATIAGIRPSLAVVDSVQTVYDAAVPGTPGSPSQVREAVGRLLFCAKSTGVAIVLVGHVTKEGAIAGPRTLEHMVDVVLYLEGERHGEHRLLRGIKNRFGATGELGLFEMLEEGMREVGAPGRALLDEASLGIPGSSLTVVCEGSRALVVEIQALAATSSLTFPRRTVSGFDAGRLHLLLAVLERRASIRSEKLDVYLNAVGGARVGEPAADLAAALAIAGSVRDRSLPGSCAVIGEVGLGGEVRRVRRLDARLAEAAALGLDGAIIPSGHDGPTPEGLHCRRVGSLVEAIGLLG